MSATSASPSPDSGLPALPAALPMQTGPASQITTAPPAAALPAPRRYVGVSRFSNDRDAYAYLDRASDTEDEIGDAPPDYDYDYEGGVRPWVWETGNGDYQYAEPVDGGYRYYYYQPGADYPYLVRTRDYSYAYAGGALVAIYALSGALLPPDQYGRYRDQASRYFSRGQQLRQYSDQRPHQGVIAANWAARRDQFSAAQAHWASARAQQPAWQSYHAQNDPSHQAAAATGTSATPADCPAIFRLAVARAGRLAAASSCRAWRARRCGADGGAWPQRRRARHARAARHRDHAEYGCAGDGGT